MSRYRLLLAPAEEAVLRDHCAHARFVWNLAVEQISHWYPGRKSAPGYLEQCRQLKTSTDIARRFDVIRVEDLQRRPEDSRRYPPNTRRRPAQAAGTATRNRERANQVPVPRLRLADPR